METQLTCSITIEAGGRNFSLSCGDGILLPLVDQFS